MKNCNRAMRSRKGSVRPIDVRGRTAFVPLTQGYEAIIDAADVPLIDQWNWSALVTRRPDGSIRLVYAVRTLRKRGSKSGLRYLHQAILPLPEGLEVDHRDGNGLNCRRGNLRAATFDQNRMNLPLSAANTSGAKGVSFNKRCNKWQSQIGIGGRLKYLGLFADFAAAKAAYERASAEFHGEFGRSS